MSRVSTDQKRGTAVELAAAALQKSLIRRIPNHRMLERIERTISVRQTVVAGRPLPIRSHPTEAAHQGYPTTVLISASGAASPITAATCATFFAEPS